MRAFVKKATVRVFVDRTRSVFAASLLALVASVATGCSGGGGGGVALAPQTAAPAATATAASSATASISFSVTVPQLTSASARTRRPDYVSPSTKSLIATFLLQGANASQTQTFYIDVQPANNPNCTRSTAASTVCVATFTLPQGGVYTASILAYDVGLDPVTKIPMNGNVLSQATSVPVTAVAGANTALNVTLQGVPKTVAVFAKSAAGLLLAGAGGLTLPACFTSQQVGVYALDADNNVIVGPGQPTVGLTTTATGFTVAAVGGGNASLFTLTSTLANQTANATIVASATASGASPITTTSAVAFSPCGPPTATPAPTPLPTAFVPPSPSPPTPTPTPAPTPTPIVGYAPPNAGGFGFGVNNAGIASGAAIILSGITTNCVSGAEPGCGAGVPFANETIQLTVAQATSSSARRSASFTLDRPPIALLPQTGPTLGQLYRGRPAPHDATGAHTGFALSVAPTAAESSRLARVTRVAQSGRRQPADAQIVYPTTLGSTASFYVPTQLPGAVQIQVTATLVLATSHAYVWLDNQIAADGANGKPVPTQATLAAYGSAFETAYAVDSQHFGTPEYTTSSPGYAGKLGPYQDCDTNGNVVNDAGEPFYIAPPNGKHIVLIVSPKGLNPNFSGFHSAVDQIRRGVSNCFSYETSNEASMVTLKWPSDATFTTPDIQTFESQEDAIRLAAGTFENDVEFAQHFMVHSDFSQTLSDQSFIEYGLGALAGDFAIANRYGNQPALDVDSSVSNAAASYLAAPHYASLTAVGGGDQRTGAAVAQCSGCIGAAYLFQRYLYDRFGGDAYLHALIQSSSTGYGNLQAAIGGYPVSTAITDFGIALAASGTGLTTDSRFSFTSFNPYGTYTDQFGRSVSLQGPATFLLGGQVVGRDGAGVMSTIFAGAFAYLPYQIPGGYNTTINFIDQSGNDKLAGGILQL
jgi:hypothetical protein